MTWDEVMVSTDCVCDLPEELCEKYHIPIMYYYIRTKEARFQDTREITSEDLMELIAEDKKQVRSRSASTVEYKEFFQKLRKRTKGIIIHICMAKYVSEAYNNAVSAAEAFEKIYVVDSGQLSGGMGIMVLTAADMAYRGAGAELILDELEHMRRKVSSSFIVDSTESLYQGGRISETVHKICQLFELHPILEMSGSKMKPVGICIGGQQRIAKAYIRRTLRKENIRKEIVFLITAGCSYEFQEFLKEEIQKRMQWDVMIVNAASATITCNCGAGAFGLLFLTS